MQNAPFGLLLSFKWITLFALCLNAVQPYLNSKRGPRQVMVSGHMWQPYLQASCFCLQKIHPEWPGEASVEQSGLDDDSPVTMTGTNTVVSTVPQDLYLFIRFIPHMVL